MADQWNIWRADQPIGPLSESELIERAARGELGPSDLVSQDQQTWVRAATLGQLTFADLDYRAPAPQPPSTLPVERSLTSGRRGLFLKTFPAVAALAGLSFFGGTQFNRPAPDPAPHQDTASPAPSKGWAVRGLEIPTQTSEPSLSDIDSTIESLVEQALTTWEVPGAAVAVVKDGEVVFTRGFGIRRLGDSATVDRDTLFTIGSATKGFTAALVGMLVDEGKAEWDEPVIKALPSFKLYDPAVTSQVTLRDLLCHRVGLPRKDDLWSKSGLDRGEVLRRIGEVQPKWDFRTHFGYQNIMYLAAGEASAHLAGTTWGRLVEDRIFQPLEMTASKASSTALAQPGNVAAGHELVEGRLQPIAVEDVDNCAPATAICSTVVDMARWMQFQLADGTFDGRSLLAPSTVRQMQTPQIVIPPDDPLWKMFPEKTQMAYGLGWIVQDYRNRKVVQHPGNVNGMRAIVALMPEEKLGVVVLANRMMTPLPIDLMYGIFDLYLDVPAAERAADRQRVTDYLKQQEAEKQSGIVFAAAKKLLDSRQYDEAIERFNEAIRLHPQSAYAYNGRGIARKSKGDIDGALDDYTKAVEIDPNFFDSYRNRGILRKSRGDLDGALADATRAIQIDPRNPEPYFDRALAEKAKGNLDGVIADTSRAIELNPKHATAYAVRGLARLAQGRETQAQEDFQKGTAIQPALQRAIAKEIESIRRSGRQGQ